MRATEGTMFNDIIVDNFTNPVFAAQLNDADMVIELGNPVCGDRIKVQLKLVSDHIEVIRYQAWGCATSLATSNIFCAHANDQPLAKVLATPQDVVENMLGELDPSQYHCLDMLKALFTQLKHKAEQAR